VHYPRPRCEGVAGGATTVAQKATIMKSTMVLSTDTSGRTLRVDMGWPACDERLVTVAEAQMCTGSVVHLPVARRAVSRRKK
jgi:uncharacterized membrane protein